MKSTTLPDKVQTAIDVLGQYEISTSDVAPFWYRQYLRFKPDTPPPLWGASKGYWDSLTVVYAFAIGGIVEAATGYLAWQDQDSRILAMGFNPFTQAIIWTLAGLLGWVLAYNSRCRCRTERTSIGLPAWGEFHSTWRISREFLQLRTAPERYWLASMLGKPIFTRAWLAGIALFGLLAWQLPMKVGDISAAESMGFFVFCLIASARTEQGKVMPANPTAWQCGSGFWLGFTTAAVMWTGVANMLGLPKNNETLVYGSGSFLLIAIEIARYQRQSNFMKRVEVAEQKKQLVEAQLQTLKAQIEPHFIFNTIAHLKTLIATDPKSAERMADELSDFLRASLHALRANWTTVGEDFLLAHAYLEIAKLRMGSRVSANLRMNDNARNVKIPPLILQTLLENAIQHGIEPKVGASMIQVTADVVEKDGELRLHLCVVDDGAGFGQSATGGSGVGLANIRERLASAYGSHATLTLTANTPSGVIAELNLPVDKTV